MGNHIELLARGVCVKQGKVLLCRTGGAEITYLPGGHIEFNETAREALDREILEELGKPSTAGRFLGVVEHSFLQNGERHCEWNAVFELDIPDLPSDQPVNPEEAHLSFSWCPLDKLRDARLEPAVLCDLLPQWLWNSSGNDCWSAAGDLVR